ncbi:MAG TPA: fatty acid--CoA ligase family protein [Stellaceae bacterium]|nr:fatty acid--CoA ligase family protein [Stellaceae bacterium]
MNHLAKLLDAAISTWPQRLAMEGVDGTFTYRDLGAQAGALEERLNESRIARDEPVCVRVANGGRDLAAFLGIWRAGGVVVPVHRGALPATLEDVLRRTGARFLVDGVDAAIIGPPPPLRPLLAGAAFIVFTSGTTGEPKGVVLSHEGFAGKLAAIDQVIPFTASSTTLLVLQLTFSFGQWVSLLTLARGGTLILHEKFEPRTFLKTLGSSRIHRFGAVPTMLRAALARLREEPQPAPGGEILCMAGGEVLPPALSRELRRAMPGLAIADMFGLTETGTCDFILKPEEMDRHPGTLGRPSPHVEFRLDDTGELLIKTPYGMRGYLDQPDLTLASFHEGYFRTGDLAEVTEAGMVRLIGRRKEIIARAGNKIAPLEIERVFLDHPGITAALATGLPDERLGEAIHLLVVPGEGVVLQPAELRQWAAMKLERYKLPDVIHIGSEIPLGRTGKADRGALKARLLG